MMRRVGESVVAGKRYRLRPGAYGVAVLDGRVLVTHQSRPLPEFQLPGGGIDPGESPLVALHREFYEETGWRIAGPRKLGAYRRFTYMPEYDLWAEKICHIYRVRPTLRLGPPIEPHHTALWIEAGQVGAVIENPGDRLWALRALQL